jgi:cell division protein FtsB
VKGGYPLVRIVVMLVFLLLFVVVGSMLLNQKKAYDRVFEKTQNLEQLEKQAIAENENVRHMNDRIGSDDYIEEIAREKLGLVKTQETVFVTDNG